MWVSDVDIFGWWQAVKNTFSEVECIPIYDIWGYKQTNTQTFEKYKAL